MDFHYHHKKKNLCINLIRGCSFELKRSQELKTPGSLRKWDLNIKIITILRFFQNSWWKIMQRSCNGALFSRFCFQLFVGLFCPHKKTKKLFFSQLNTKISQKRKPNKICFEGQSDRKLPGVQDPRSSNTTRTFHTSFVLCLTNASTTEA